MKDQFDKILAILNSWTVRILAAGLAASLLAIVGYYTASQIKVFGFITVGPGETNSQLVEIAAEKDQVNKDDSKEPDSKIDE